MRFAPAAGEDDTDRDGVRPGGLLAARRLLGSGWSLAPAGACLFLACDLGANKGSPNCRFDFTVKPQAGVWPLGIVGGVARVPP